MPVWLQIKFYYFDVNENPANKRHALRGLRSGRVWTNMHSMYLCIFVSVRFILNFYVDLFQKYRHISCELQSSINEALSLSISLSLSLSLSLSTA